MDACIQSILFLIVLTSSINGQGLNMSSCELKATLKTLFGGQGPLSDFVFYDRDSISTYLKTKGPPRNRTELRRNIRILVKNRTETEITLAKALNQYMRGENVKAITLAVKQLTRVVNKKNHGRRRRRSTRRRTRITQDINQIFQNEVEEFKEFRKKVEHDIMEDSLRNAEEEIYDHKRVRRESVSFTYTGTPTCYAEGSQGTISTVKLLCATCYKTVDFGSKM